MNTESLNNFFSVIDNDTTLTETSKKNYKSKIKILADKKIDLHSNEEQIITKLKEVYPKSNSTYKSMIYPIIKYRNTVDLPTDNLKEEYTSITKTYTKKQEEQQTDKPLMSLEDLKKFKKKIPTTNRQFKLLFSLYTEHPPVRNDFYDLKHKNFDTATENYYDSITKKIVLNRFKTAKHYDPIEISLSRSEVGLMNKLIKLSGDDYIFHNTKNSVMDSRGFTEMLNREFKKLCGLELGSSDLRKIYITDNSDKSLKERKEIAVKMGHTVQEAELFYKKINI